MKTKKANKAEERAEPANIPLHESLNKVNFIEFGNQNPISMEVPKETKVNEGVKETKKEHKEIPKEVPHESHSRPNSIGGKSASNTGVNNEPKVEFNINNLIIDNIMSNMKETESNHRANSSSSKANNSNSNSNN
jgi:hypothetical protein